MTSLVPAQSYLLLHVPDKTPNKAEIFLASSLNDWNPKDPLYRLQRLSATKYLLSIDYEGKLEGKFTRGNWDKVETDSVGHNLPNRKLKFKKGDTLTVHITAWQDRLKVATKHTFSPQVSIMDSAFYMPQLDRYRRVWVYLPPDYQTSGERFPVLYMHDGQNIFDALISYSGEWEVDETLDRTGIRMIVVGIDNGGERRMTEYGPQDHSRFGKAEGDAYLDFLVQTLKPHIDSTYPTLPDRQHTGLMGSSMGGLITYYAALKHPGTFGRLGVFSPSFWHSPSLFDQTKQELAPKTFDRMYFLIGKKEGGKMVRDTQRMQQLVEKVAPSHQVKGKIVADGIHNESFWAGEFEEAIRWLFELE